MPSLRPRLQQRRGVCRVARYYVLEPQLRRAHDEAQAGRASVFLGGGAGGGGGDGGRAGLSRATVREGAAKRGIAATG